MKKSKIFILICTLSNLIILCVISAQPLPKQKNKVVPPPEKQLNPLNIIYILADDLGYADITSTGTKYLNESYKDKKLLPSNKKWVALLPGSKAAKLKIGICCDHGGDPDSIHFFDKVGLDYVSCSPYRIPIARLASAQATIKTSL